MYLQEDCCATMTSADVSTLSSITPEAGYAEIYQEFRHHPDQYSNPYYKACPEPTPLAFQPPFSPPFLPTNGHSHPPCFVMPPEFVIQGGMPPCPPSWTGPMAVNGGHESFQ